MSIATTIALLLAAPQAEQVAPSSSQLNEQVSTPARFVEGAILDSDYPAAAVAAGAEGRTGIEFVITPDGRVRTCGVVDTSGNKDLDLASCDLVRARFVFEPARDRLGRAMQEHRRQAIVWRLPAGSTVFKPDAYDYGVVLTVGPDGKVISCEVTGALDPKADRGQLCRPMTFAPPVNALGRPVTRRVRFRASLTVEDTGG